MADETRDLILSNMTDQRLGEIIPKDSQLPATTEPTETAEPSETRDLSQGKSPDEVVGELQTRQAPETTVETTEADPDAPQKYPVSEVITDANGRLQRVTRHYTAAEIVEKGMLGKIVTSANQFPVVQAKYQGLLESNVANKGAEPKAAEQPKDVVPQWQLPPPEKVHEHYRPVAAEYVKAGWIEGDFAELYPKETAVMAWLFDRLAMVEQRAIAVDTERTREKAERIAAETWAMLHSAIDGAAATKGPDGKLDHLYDGLRDPERRGKFIKWLREEIDPKVGALTTENMRKQWLAHNEADVLGFIQKAGAQVQQPRDSRRARGDGRTGSGGAPDAPKEKGLLDSMTDMKLGNAA